jgi:3-oxoacyl-[acyl-carrier protein] reductase
MAKKILITGASTGIGACAAECLAPGNEIFVHYNSSGAEAENVAGNVRKNGGTARLVRADIGTEEGCLALVRQIKEITDTLDVLVNNAGAAFKRKPISEVTWDFLHQVFAVNVYSVITITGNLEPLLKKGTDPCIINLASIAMYTGSPDTISYAGAKAAVAAFTHGMAANYAPAIRVNTIAPGAVDTPFHEKVTDPEKFKHYPEAIPLRKVGRPEHIASAIRFLIENSYTTGACLDINGGQYMR